jgi:hypothetical protein
MKNAPTPNPDGEGISLNESLRVTHRLDRMNFGSCNACKNPSYSVSQGRELVTEVWLRNLTFRLCASCCKQLKELL